MLTSNFINITESCFFFLFILVRLSHYGNHGRGVCRAHLHIRRGKILWIVMELWKAKPAFHINRLLFLWSGVKFSLAINLHREVKEHKKHETERENTLYYSDRIGLGANWESRHSRNFVFLCTAAHMLHCSAQYGRGGFNCFLFPL